MPGTDDGIEVLHLPDEERFVVRADGTEAELVYRVQGGRMILVHTGVPDQLGGRGVGGLLVSAAMRHAGAEGLAVAPWCPFAGRFLREHPEAARGVTIDWTPPPGDSDAKEPGAARTAHIEQVLDEQEDESFPASDPHSDWAGPPD